VRLLVLGGTRFVGRWVVTAAVKRGWTVTTLNRGRGPWAHPAAERLVADRLRPGDVGAAAGDRTWDMVVDTWAGAPRIVRESATALAGRAGSYRYVSSRAVYAEPVPAGVDETAPTVEAASDAGSTAYGADKRGGEMAVEQAFGDRAVLARAGPILGPLEDRNQLPHWLRRAEMGGPMPVPGPPDQPFAYIDIRDLVAWLLDAGSAGQAPVTGPVNLVAPPGHATVGDLIAAVVTATGGHARPVWITPDAIARSGVDRWDAFPGWIPPAPELAGYIRTDVTKALATGLECRPLGETVADTWSWLTGHAGPEPATLDVGWERQFLTGP
jgi:nucleoside-diphosphate-sugar epimerase